MNSPVQIPRFRFILQPEFPLNALILASEALRIANQNSGKHLFDWTLVSITGKDVRASNGMWITVDHGLNALSQADYYFIFAGNLPTQNNSSTLLRKLREMYCCGATVVGVDTGAFVLAQAGLINESTIVHWEAAPTFLERFPRLQIKDHLYQTTGTVISCAGGIATLDLMLYLIKQHYGESLSSEVANALVYQPREAAQPQRTDNRPTNNMRSLSERLIRLMQQNLDFPLTARVIAGKLNVSQSTLERHCRRHLGNSLMSLYRGVRLTAARNHLFYTDGTIYETAFAFGFSSVSVFSRTFKTYFGQTPSKFRMSFREKQNHTRLPEVDRLYLSRREVC